VADVFRPLPLPAGTTIQAARAGAHAYICRPALVVDSDPRYNNPRGLYFSRLARLRTLTLHRQTVQVPPGSAMGSVFTTDFPTDASFRSPAATITPTIYRLACYVCTA